MKSHTLKLTINRLRFDSNNNFIISNLLDKIFREIEKHAKTFQYLKQFIAKKHYI